MSIVKGKNPEANTIMLDYDFCNIHMLRTKMLKGTDLSFKKVKIVAEAPGGKEPYLEAHLAGNYFYLLHHTRYRGGVGIEMNFDAAFDALREIDRKLIKDGIECKWRIEYMILYHGPENDDYYFRTEVEKQVHCMYMEFVSDLHYTFLSKDQFMACRKTLANITYTACYKKNAKKEPAQKCGARFQTDEQLKDMDDSIRNVWN